MRRFSRVAAALIAMSCGCSSSSGSAPATPPTDATSSGRVAGVCSGTGWGGTCDFLTTCSGGRFEVKCGSGARYKDGTRIMPDAGPDDCACLYNHALEKTVTRDTAWCLPASGEGDRTAARLAMGAACGWVF